MKNINSSISIPLLMAGLLWAGCGSVKYSEMLLFEHVGNELGSLTESPALIIRSDDILSIEVSSRNPENVLAFRQIRDNIGAATAMAPGIPEGYRVDDSGNIYLPFVGQIKAADKTIPQLREEVVKRLADYIPDASVQVRFMNFRVTLMGEVIRPNTYIIPNERLTILEAIGMAGDFTPYARRDAVLVIRERNQQREFARVDVQDKNLFRSPYFYLSPNDIVYIEPLKAKQYATTGDFMQRYAILIVPFISFVTLWVGGQLLK
jgi:polysaccharide biosynthesis/export protein